MLQYLRSLLSLLRLVQRRYPPQLSLGLLRWKRKVDGTEQLIDPHDSGSIHGIAVYLIAVSAVYYERLLQGVSSMLNLRSSHLFISIHI